MFFFFCLFFCGICRDSYNRDAIKCTSRNTLLLRDLSWNNTSMTFRVARPAWEQSSGTMTPVSRDVYSTSTDGYFWLDRSLPVPRGPHSLRRCKETFLPRDMHHPGVSKASNLRAVAVHAPDNYSACCSSRHGSPPPTAAASQESMRSLPRADRPPSFGAPDEPWSFLHRVDGCWSLRISGMSSSVSSGPKREHAPGAGLWSTPVSRCVTRAAGPRSGPPSAPSDWAALGRSRVVSLHGSHHGSRLVVSRDVDSRCSRPRHRRIFPQSKGTSSSCPLGVDFLGRGELYTAAWRQLAPGSHHVHIYRTSLTATLRGPIAVCSPPDRAIVRAFHVYPASSHRNQAFSAFSACE